MAHKLFVEVDDIGKIVKNILVCSVRAHDEFAHKINRWLNALGKNGHEGTPHYQRVSNTRAYGNSDFCPTLFSEFMNKDPIEPEKVRERVEGKSVYIVAHSALTLDRVGQTSSSQEIAMRTLIQARAAKRTGASQVTLVMPNVVYARQDTEEEDGIDKYTGQADTLNAFIETCKLWGADKILTIHSHSPNLQKFGEEHGVEIVSLPHRPLYAHFMRYRSGWDLGEGGINIAVCAPDQGAWADVDAIGQTPGLELATRIYYRKDRLAPNNPNLVKITLDHVENFYDTLEDQMLVNIDDIMDTCGTQRKSNIATLKDGIAVKGHGDGEELRSIPRDIAIMCTHPVFSGEHYVSAQQRLILDRVREVVFCNTNPTFEREQIGPLKERSTVLRLANYFLNAMIALELKLNVQETFSYEKMVTNPNGFGTLYDIVRSSMYE